MDPFSNFNEAKRPSNHSKRIIIPVASGKGGVGKTFLAANLAIALAEAGNRVIAADLDFGGTNLHSFLGMSNRFPGIGDFLKARSAELSELLVPTEIPNLLFLPGDGKTPFMANIAHVQKVKLIRHFRKLTADYVLLDLGAGTTFNTLDFFGLARKGILVTTPEPTAVMGMLVFLKNLLLRLIERKMARNYAVHNMLRELFKRPMDEQMVSIKDVHQKIIDEDPQSGEVIAQIYQDCRPRIIFNMGENPEDSKMAFKISRTLSEILCIEADYFGFIYKDPSVLSAIRNRCPFLPNYRKSPAAENMVRVAQRTEKFWDQALKDSASLLFSHVQKDFVTRRASSAAV